MKKCVLILVVCCLVISCQSVYYGKRFDTSCLYPLQGELKHHYIKYPHATFDYDFAISDDQKTITFDGKIIMNPDGEISGGEKLLEMVVEFIFCDSNGVVVGSGYYTTGPMTVYDSVKFKKSYPYNPKYKWMIIGYRGAVD